MQLRLFLSLAGGVILSACAQGQQSVDPLEPLNRSTFKFNRAFDATVSKPLATLYQAALPQRVRDSVNNAFNNLATIPAVCNDVLQGEFRHAIKDTWRFAINSTLGVAGLFDVASTSFGLAPHYNDLGITFAKWGVRQSPYLMIPLLGPSTIRDAVGYGTEYFIMTPFPYIQDQGLVWGLWGLRYVDLRSQLFEQEQLMKEAMDPYTFVRDAWLQHRQYRINGEQPELVSGTQSEAMVTEKNDVLGQDYVD